MCINYIDLCQYNAANWPIVGPSRSSPCSRVSPAVTPRWESRSCCISALVSVKYRTNSARVISPNPRSRACSCAENTSRVATASAASSGGTTRSGQENQLDSLGIMINIIVLWQTVYVQAALDHLAANGYPLDPADVARLTPLGHPTINLQGRYRTTSRP